MGPPLWGDSVYIHCYMLAHLFRDFDLSSIVELSLISVVSCSFYLYSVVPLCTSRCERSIEFKVMITDKD